MDGERLVAHRTYPIAVVTEAGIAVSFAHFRRHERRLDAVVMNGDLRLVPLRDGEADGHFLAALPVAASTGAHALTPQQRGVGSRRREERAGYPAHRQRLGPNDLEYRRKQLLRLQDAVIDFEDLSGGVAITDPLPARPVLPRVRRRLRGGRVLLQDVDRRAPCCTADRCR